MSKKTGTPNQRVVMGYKERKRKYRQRQTLEKGNKDEFIELKSQKGGK